MNDQSSSSKFHYKNPNRKLGGQRESQKSFKMSEHFVLSQSKDILSKADHNVHSLISSILYNCDEDDFSNFNINTKLKQIRNNTKKTFKRRNSSSSSDGIPFNDSKNIRINKHTLSKKIDSTILNEALAPNPAIFHAKSLKKQLNNNIAHLSNNNLNFLTKQSNISKNNNDCSPIRIKRKRCESQKNFTFQFNAQQQQQVGQSQLQLPTHLSKKNLKLLESSDDDANCINHIIPLNIQSIRDLNKIREEMHESINLNNEQFKETTLINDPQLCHVYEEDKTQLNDSSSSINFIPKQDTIETDPHKDSPYRFLYKKHHQVYDSLSEEENLDDATFYIEAKSIYKFSFDTLMVFLSLFSFFHLPFSIAFLHKGSNIIYFNFIINAIVDILYGIDFIASFITAYEDREEHSITNNLQILKHYLKGWFFSDLISGIPINSLIDFVLLFYPESEFTIATFTMYANNNMTLLHLLRLLRLFRAFKIVFNNTFITYLCEVFDFSQSKWTLLNISFILFFSTVNLLGCIFVFLGYSNYPNWFENKQIEPSDKFDVYVGSIYFILLTIVSIGYGDIVTTNIVERIFNVFLLIVGIMIYSWAISALSNYLEGNNAQIVEMNQKLKLLETIKSSHDNFPQALNEQIKRYLKSHMEHEQSNAKEILDQLPWILRNALTYNMYKPILHNFKFFDNFSNDEFCMKVLTAFIPIVYLRNERIINDGDYLEEMFFVKNGTMTLELTIPSVLTEEIHKTLSLSNAFTTTINPWQENSSNRKLSLKNYQSNRLATDENHIIEKKIVPTGYEEKYARLIDIRKNEHFGDIMMFLNQRCPLSVRVKTRKAELFLLKKKDVIKISLDYPKIWRKIIKKSIFNLEQINRLIKKTLRFYFVQNQACFNHLEKKFNYFKKSSKAINAPSNTSARPDGCLNWELASIPSKMNETSEEENSQDNNNNNFSNKVLQRSNTNVIHLRNMNNNSNSNRKITEMLSKEDNNSNDIKLSESSTANLITPIGNQEQEKYNRSAIKNMSTFSNDSGIQQGKSGSGISSMLVKAKDSFRKLVSLSDKKSINDSNYSMHGLSQISNSQIKHLNETLHYTSSFRNNNQPPIEISIVDNLNDTKISQTIKYISMPNEINDEFDFGEHMGIIPSTIPEEIDWNDNDDNANDTSYKKKNEKLKEFFRQKPDYKDILKPPKPSFKYLMYTKTESIEYVKEISIDNLLTRQKTSTFFQGTEIQQPKTPSNSNSNREKINIAINVISTAPALSTLPKIPALQLDNLADKNILSWNKPFDECPSINNGSNSNRGSNTKFRNSILSEQNGNCLSSRSNASNAKNENNECYERLLSKKRTTVDIFKIRTNRKGTVKENKEISKRGTIMRSNCSLLQVIGENIHDNSMNLNNHVSFYSNTFANMLDNHRDKVMLTDMVKRLHNIYGFMQDHE